MWRSNLVKHATVQVIMFECLKKMPLKKNICRASKKMNCLIPNESRGNGGPTIKILSFF